MADCVRSGYCCKRAPCAYGMWDESRGQCAYLIRDPSSQHGQYLCGKYEEISAKSDAWINPAFGAGCSSPLFNMDRDRVIRAVRRLEVIR